MTSEWIRHQDRKSQHALCLQLAKWAPIDVERPLAIIQKRRWHIVKRREHNKNKPELCGIRPRAVDNTAAASAPPGPSRMSLHVEAFEPKPTTTLPRADTLLWPPGNAGISTNTVTSSGRAERTTASVQVQP
ncbi:hypothetical protein ACLKA6_003554 [Drosophila palustris]